MLNKEFRIMKDKDRVKISFAIISQLNGKEKKTMIFFYSAGFHFDIQHSLFDILRFSLSLNISPDR